jgi:hypothetical protein
MTRCDFCLWRAVEDHWGGQRDGEDYNRGFSRQCARWLAAMRFCARSATGHDGRKRSVARDGRARP